MCRTDEGFSFENNFRDDCCNCVQGGECLPLTTSASLLNHSQCCISASNNITTLLLQNEPSDVCSQSHPFTSPEYLSPINEVMTLPPNTYVVPTFQFQCQGCVDEIQVQGQVTDYTHPNPINITMSFMIWARFVDTEDDQDSLYQLRKNVTRTVTELDITPEDALGDQLTINFSLTDSSDLCFSRNEVFGFSFGDTPALLVILDDDEGSTYSLSLSVDDTCPELMDYYTATLVQEDRVPLMAIRIRFTCVSKPILLDVYTGPPQPSPSLTQVPLQSTTVGSTPTTSTTGSTTSSTFSIVVGVSVPLVVLTITAFIIIISVTVCVRRRKRKRAAAENIALCSIGSQLKPTNENSPEEYDYVSVHQPHPLQPRPTTDTDSARRDVLTTSNQAYGVTQGGDGVTENVAYGVGQNEFTRDTAGEEGEKYEYVTRNDVIITAARNEAYGVTGDVSLTSNDAYGLVA